MARDIVVNGESLVSVKGGAHLAPGPVGVLSELGLSTDEIRITPRFMYRDVRVDDYGDMPAEVQWMGGDASIHMTLVHWDLTVLQVCVKESMGGWINVAGGNILPGRFDGSLGPVGVMMGRGLALQASGNRFVSLNIASPENGSPWRFPAAYLADRPFEYPLGTGFTAVSLTWRAIAYKQSTPVTFYDRNGAITTRAGEVRSSGAILWDRNADT